MFGKQDRLAYHPEVLGEIALQIPLLEEFFLQPDRHGGKEGGKPTRSESEVGLQQTVKLQEGLLVENDPINLLKVFAGFPQAITNGMNRKTGILLFPGESLFLGGRNDLPITDEAGSRIVIVCGNPENVHPILPSGRSIHRR
jgi:hypothetical protein